MSHPCSSCKSVAPLPCRTCKPPCPPTKPPCPPIRLPCPTPCPTPNCNACNQNPCNVSTQSASCQQIACLEQKICTLSNIINIILGQLPGASPSPLCFSEFHLPLTCPNGNTFTILPSTPFVDIDPCAILPIQIVVGNSNINVDLSTCNPTDSFSLSCPGTGLTAFTVPAACGGCYEVTINLNVAILADATGITSTENFNFDVILAEYTCALPPAAPTVIASSTVFGTLSYSLILISAAPLRTAAVPAGFQTITATGIACLRPGQSVGPAFFFRSGPDLLNSLVIQTNSFNIMFRQLSSATCV